MVHFPGSYTPGSTNIAMEKGAFEDVFPIDDVDIPASYVSLPKGTSDSLMKNKCATSSSRFDETSASSNQKAFPTFVVFFMVFCGMFISKIWSEMLGNLQRVLGNLQKTTYTPEN